METQRFPLSVRIIGVMHKEKSKMYMTSVLWSDHNDIIVYRTFHDFKKMHKQLKKTFPTTNMLKKSDRIIPKFRDKTMMTKDQRSPTKSLLCLKFLQKYCDELLSCDPRVCQSADLIHFFHPKDQDLLPEYSKNGILIMPTDDEIRSGHAAVGNVTQPFVTETYRCVAPYETRDTKNKAFKVAVDELVDVLIRDKSGWWLVEKEDKRMAWFPAPYLEKQDEDAGAENEDDVNGTFQRGARYTAVKSYTASSHDEINVPIGAVVEVLENSDNGWWLISYGGRAGYVPAMYLQPYNYPHIRMATQIQDHRPSSRLELPSSGLQQTQQLSRSQGNLLQLPPVRAPSPGLLQPQSKQRSHSLNVLTEPAPAQPAFTASALRAATMPMTARLPAIKVELDGEGECDGVPAARSEGSLGSGSSSGSNFSLRDDVSISSGNSFLNLNQSGTEERLGLSRTPPPTLSPHLSPTSGPEVKISSSVSDPNLYKAPSSPKVPPRPRAQEILTHCSSVTRKRTTSGNLSPTQTEIVGR